MKHAYSHKIIRDIASKYPVRIFGIILYNKSHANIAKVLRDADYWASFDEISGADWPIFAVSPKVESIPPAICSIEKSTIAFNYMINYSDSIVDNQSLLQDLGLEGKVELPCFVAFIWDDKEDMQYTACTLNDSSVATAYQSIKAVVAKISETVSKIDKAYAKTINVYREVSKDLQALELREVAANMKKGLLGIAEVSKYITGIIK